MSARVRRAPAWAWPLAAVLLLAGGPAAADGYRMSHYRAPVPDAVPGATTIGVERAAGMQRAGEAVFLDVIPAPPRPAGRSDWNPPPRATLPGAHWLPNVGRGAISDATDAYYRAQLKRLTGGDRDRPLVIFCERDCWMSWNAAKRALDYGYGNVYWFPDGTNGWADSGRALERRQPEGQVPH